MRALLNPESPFMRFLTRIGYAIWLNLLWMLCSIPLFTIGASTTALYAVMHRVVRDEEGRLTASFFRAFRENFRQSTGAWAILAGFGLLLGVDAYILFHLRYTGVFWTLLTAVFILAAAAWCIVLLYTFPILARFDNTIPATLKNALLTGMHFLFCTALLIAVHAAVGWVIIFVYTPVLFLGEGLCALVSSWLLRGVIQQLEEKADGHET